MFCVTRCTHGFLWQEDKMLVRSSLLKSPFLIQVSSGNAVCAPWCSPSLCPPRCFKASWHFQETGGELPLPESHVLFQKSLDAPECSAPCWVRAQHSKLEGRNLGSITEVTWGELGQNLGVQINICALQL